MSTTVPISGLPVASSVNDADIVPIVQSGVTMQATAALIQRGTTLAKTILNYGVVGDGSDESVAVQSAINTMVAAGLTVVFPPTPNGYSFWNVTLPAGAMVIGHLTTILAPSGSNAGANRTSSVFKVSGDNVTVSGFLFRGAVTTDTPAFIQNLGNSSFTCHGCHFITNVYEAIIDRAGTGTLIADCDIRMGVGGAYGVGVSFIGNCRHFEVRDTDIRGYRVTKPQSGSGVQPSGDLWGSVGINCQIGTQFDTLGWKHVSGTYTIVDLIPGDINIADAQIVDPGNWEGAVVVAMDSTYGVGSQSQNAYMTFSNGQLTLKNLPGYSIGAVVTYRAYSYENSPRYGIFSDVHVTGMIYAGISAITGRDISCSSCTFSNIGDIAWDCEGTLRCSCTGSTFVDCSTGAVPGGFGAAISGNLFKYCGRVIGAWGASIAYQGDAALVPFGLRGMSDFSRNTFFDDTLAANDRSVCECEAPFVTVCGNVALGKTLKSFVFTNAYQSVFTNNTAFERIEFSGCKYVRASDNTVQSPQQGGMRINTCDHFSIVNTAICNTSGAYGDGSGITYTNCSYGEIYGTRGLAVLYAVTPGDSLVVDGGGNSNVTVSGSVSI